MIYIIYLLNHGFSILNFKLQALHVTVELLLGYEGKKDIVFRFIREYSSLRDFYRPLGNNNRSIFK